MIVHKHSTIFIHIPKTAGRSIVKGLFSRNRGTHVTASGMRNLDPASFAAYFKFSVVRNPWDRLVSFYTMCRTSNAMPHRILMQRCNILYGSTTFANFIRFVEHILAKEPGILSDMGFESDFELHPQRLWLYGVSNELLVDYVCKFETLHNCYNHLCETIGLSDRKNKLPRIGASKRRGSYQGSYTNELRDTVGELYELDCSTFDYSF